jgi:hypothetical protein
MWLLLVVRAMGLVIDVVTVKMFVIHSRIADAEKY